MPAFPLNLSGSCSYLCFSVHPGWTQMQDIQVKVWLNPPCVVHTQHGSLCERHSLIVCAPPQPQTLLRVAVHLSSYSASPVTCFVTMND